MEEQQQQLLKNDYYKTKPWSYGSQPTLKKYLVTNKAGKRVNVDKLLSSLDIWSKFKQFRRPRVSNPVFVYSKRHLFQSDTIFFTNEKMVKANNGYKYCLVIIDAATKYTWNYPVKSLKCNGEILSKFEHVFKICGRPPRLLQTDRGSEYRCKALAKLFQKYNIHHYFSYSENKACIAERFNLTLQSLLYKMMEKFDSLQWTKFLPLAVSIYHQRIHSSIKMSPLQAELDSSQLRLSKIHAQRYRKIKKKKPRFKQGDVVRIARNKTKFSRGYLQHFNTEKFKITQVLTNLPIPRYTLTDAEGEKIIGAFFEHELVGVSPSPLQ